MADPNEDFPVDFPVPVEHLFDNVDSSSSSLVSSSSSSEETRKNKPEAWNKNLKSGYSNKNLATSPWINEIQKHKECSEECSQGCYNDLEFCGADYNNQLINWKCNVCDDSYDLNLFGEDRNEEIVNGNLRVDCRIRRAGEEDIPFIWGLISRDTNQLFSGYNIYHLVESSYCQFLLETSDDGELIAFAAVNDYPNPTFLSEGGWGDWLQSKYRIDNFTHQNSLFLHFLVWNKKYHGFNFMDKFIYAIFSLNSYLEYILFVVPPYKTLAFPLVMAFSDYMDKIPIPLDLREEYISRRSFEYIKDLVIASRKDFGPNVTLLLDNEQLSPETFDILKDTIQKRKSVKRWLNLIFDKPKPKRTITAICTDNQTTDIGLMSIKKHIDLLELDKHYNTFPFYGMRSSTYYDTWFKILQGKREFKCFEKKCLEAANMLLVDPITQKSCKRPNKSGIKGLTKKELEKCRLPHGFDLSDSFANEDRTPGSSEEEAEATKKEMEQRVSFENYRDAFTVIGETVKKKPTQVGKTVVRTSSEEDSVQVYGDVNKECHCILVGETVKPLKLDFLGQNLAMEIDLYDPPVNQHQTLFLRYLSKAFENIPKTYMLMRTNENTYLNPLLNFFHLIEKHGKRQLSKNALYVCHKHAVLGDYTIKRMQIGEFEEIMKMCWYHPQKGDIQKDLLSIFLKTNLFKWMKREIPTEKFQDFLSLEYKCYTFTATNLLVGFAVVKVHHDMEYYKTYYNLNNFMNLSSHSIISHGIVRHFFISPLYKHHTRLFLRKIMKANGWTSLITFSTPCHLHEFKSCSLVQELNQWIQLKPRILPEAAKVLDKREFSSSLNRTPRGVHLMTYSLSTMRKNFFECYLVIVGSGDLAVSFLEHLLLSPLNAKYGFRHITVIASDGMTRQCHSYSNVVEKMIPSNGRYDQTYRDQCNVEASVKIIHDTLTEINREKRFVKVAGGEEFHFNYLFLFCGIQFTSPILTTKPSKKCDTSRLPPRNAFTINNAYEAHIALSETGNVPYDLINVEGAVYAVYGNSIEAFCCVAGLIEMGISGYKISLLLAYEGRYKSTSYIHSNMVLDALVKALRKQQVCVYQECIFVRWEATTIGGNTYVKNVVIKSGSLYLNVKVIAIFCYDEKEVNQATRIAYKKSGLWHDKKLTIDTMFRTSDESIYAGGSLTAYSSSYRTEAYNHEFYNSIEIGAEIAKKFWEHLLFPDKVSKVDDLSKLVTFSCPLVISAEFVNGWHYARITIPGNEVLIMKDRSLNYKMLQTGNPYVDDGPGLFQLILDDNGFIREIVCYRKGKIPVNDFVTLYGKHESLLNNLLCRFEKGQLINDLFEYFSEPWALIIYDDRFNLFYKKLHCIYLKERKVFTDEVSFYDFVGYLLNLEKWETLMKEDEDFLEDVFCYNPELKQNIEMNLIEFLENNDDLLISLGLKENWDKYKSQFSTSRLLKDYVKEKGLPPCYPLPAHQIVAQVTNSRHLSVNQLPVPIKTANYRGLALERLIDYLPYKEIKQEIASEGVSEAGTGIISHELPDDSLSEVTTDYKSVGFEVGEEINGSISSYRFLSENVTTKGEEHQDKEEMQTSEPFRHVTEETIADVTDHKLFEEYPCYESSSQFVPMGTASERDDEIIEAPSEYEELSVNLENFEYEKEIEKKFKEFQKKDITRHKNIKNK